MGSLLEHFAGQVDLIYVDPPFATGADFSFKTQIGEETISKEQSVLEEKAYRDTWGRGIDSYLEMISDRLQLIKELLQPGGSLFLHIGSPIAHYIRCVVEDVFGQKSIQNEVVWQRTDAHNDARTRFGNIHDIIFWVCSAEKPRYWPDEVREDLSPAAESEYSLLELPDGQVVRYKDNEHLQGRRFKLDDATWRGSNSEKRFAWRGARPSPNREWMYDLAGMETALACGELYLRDPEKGAARCKKSYLDENKGIYLQDIWTAAGRMKGGSEYPTQKPELLLERIIKACSIERDLVADLFCGSGTSLAVAERLDRRWIGCDLSRYAIHVTRKRLMDIPGCRPFEILNLGKYERQVWQGVTFGGQKRPQQMLIFEYLKFILELYGAQPLAGTQHLHGKKGGAMVHVGAVDAPVTIAEIEACLEECRAMGQKELHILGWEWEMGLAGLMGEQAGAQGVRLLLLSIPREVMEQQAVEKGDIHFYELAYLEVEVTPSRKKRSYRATLTDFVIPNDELIPPEVRLKIKKWSDYVDYWAVDWDFQNDTFVNGWTSYRTRRDRTLQLRTDPHVYEAPGTYRILVKVIDIFGNDTSQVFELEVH
jgi:adenine-specific DNA-methyltransferase